jgi:hypothetical protein
MCSVNFSDKAVAGIAEADFFELVAIEVPPLPLRSEQPINLLPEHIKAVEKALEQKTVDELSDLSSKFTRTKKLSIDLEHGLSKHSTCTTVFVAPSTADLTSKDPTLVHEILQKVFNILHTQSKRYGGFLRQFVLDDKGLVGILAFEGAEKSHVSTTRSELLSNVSMTPSNNVRSPCTGLRVPSLSRYLHRAQQHRHRRGYRQRNRQGVLRSRGLRSEI